MLALVLLFRLLIPAGYMIAPDDAGRPGLVMCGAAAAGFTAPASHHGHHDNPADPAPAPAKSDGHPCPFASLSAPPVPPTAPAVLPPLRSAVSPPALRPIDTLASLALVAPPPPATGPPLPV